MEVRDFGLLRALDALQRRRLRIQRRLAARGGGGGGGEADRSVRTGVEVGDEGEVRKVVGKSRRWVNRLEGEVCEGCAANRLLDGGWRLDAEQPGGRGWCMWGEEEAPALETH